MINLKTTAAAALAFAIIPISAQAAENDFIFDPYVGLDFQRIAVDYDTVGGVNVEDVYEDGFNGANLYVGAKFHENFGLEAGYTRTTDQEKSNFLASGVDSNVELESWSLDLMGYLPIDNSGNFELIGTIGAAHIKAETSFSAPSASVSFDDSSTEWRAGLGLQYAFTDNWSGRTLVRYQNLDFDGAANHAILFNAGVNYSF